MYYLKFQQECQEIFLNTHKKIPTYFYAGILQLGLEPRTATRLYSAFRYDRGFRRLFAIIDQ